MATVTKRDIQSWILSALSSTTDDSKVFPILLDRFKVWYEQSCTSVLEFKRRTTKVKGDIMETFVDLYLESEGYEVLCPADSPEDLLNLLGLKRKDVGIDRIARKIRGVPREGLFDEQGKRTGKGWCGVQIKYKRRKSGGETTKAKTVIGWKALSTFYSLCSRTGPWEKLIVITNADYVRHEGKRDKRDKTIAYGTFCGISRVKWLAMCGAKGQKLGDSETSEEKEEQGVKKEEQEMKKPRRKIVIQRSEKEKVRDLRMKYYASKLTKPDQTQSQIRPKETPKEEGKKASVSEIVPKFERDEIVQGNCEHPLRVVCLYSTISNFPQPDGGQVVKREMEVIEVSSTEVKTLKVFDVPGHSILLESREKTFYTYEGLKLVTYESESLEKKGEVHSLTYPVLLRDKWYSLRMDHKIREVGEKDSSLPTAEVPSTFKHLKDNKIVYIGKNRDLRTLDTKTGEDLLVLKDFLIMGISNFRVLFGRFLFASYIGLPSRVHLWDIEKGGTVVETFKYPIIYTPVVVDRNKFAFIAPDTHLSTLAVHEMKYGETVECKEVASIAGKFFDITTDSRGRIMTVFASGVQVYDLNLNLLSSHERGYREGCNVMCLEPTQKDKEKLQRNLNGMMTQIPSVLAYLISDFI